MKTSCAIERTVVCVLFVMAGSNVSLAQEPKTQTIVAECTTGTTDAQGRRNACDSRWSELVAPDGFVFSKESLGGRGKWSAAGSENDCRIAWDKNVEVIPGSKIYQPTVLRLQAHARSAKGHGGGRGWAKCEYTVILTKYAR
jgi:hypothetical protein